MAKFFIWLFVIALLAFEIHAANKDSHSFRNRRQHITQQQQTPPLYSSSYSFNQIISRQQSDLDSLQQFLLRNNITVGANSQSYYESGNWGEWSEPSACSRSCGGGVTLQTRICLDNNCVGPSKKFTSCNTQDCDPNEVDFRELQCSKFDNQPFKERYFNWIPYLQAPNPCELNCMPRGERFYYRQAEKVIDGTRCYNDGSSDICVDGQCMPVGCDKILGSTRKEDNCGVCGGDGTTCNMMHGVFENDNLKTGYNDLFIIPAGAMNIKVEEVTPTSNYLAIRSIKGNYYLNGNWKIEFPRPMKFAGSVFNYVRKSNNGAEYLTATGPINEPLVVVLLYQEQNQGISYEYSTTKSEKASIYDQPTVNDIDRMDRYTSVDRQSSSSYQNPNVRHNQLQYRWWYGDYSPCTRHCSGGQQQRRVVCLKISALTASISTRELPANSEIVSDQNCDPRRKPAHIQNCNTHVCPAVWQVGHWSNCSCENKVKVRSVFCKKGMVHPDTGNRPIPDLWIIANDDECDEIRGANRRPHSIKPCDENESCVNTTTITVEQEQKADKNETDLNEKKQTELDDLLNELPAVPPFRKCEVTYAYKWVATNWTKCDSRCGDGNQKRNVSCIEVDPKTGKTVDETRNLPDIYCRHEAKPELERVCNDVPCEGVDWVASEWSKCVQETESSSEESVAKESSGVDVKPTSNSHLKNQTKLSTIQTRTVKCATRNGLIYGDELCGLSRKPETRRKCDKKQDVAQWFTSEWSSCSSIECGTGVRTRSVSCAVIDKEQNTIRIVDDKDCNENSKPNCEEECKGKQETCDELILIGPWTGCVDRCEETRDIVCLAKNETTNLVEPVDCENKHTELLLKRKCENEDAKDSVDPQTTECKVEDLAKNCTTTEFGCCPGPDGLAAEGSNFKGCTSKLDEECEKSAFGCCQHEKSASYGPFQLGCILNCNSTRYGCCHDQVTIALTSTLDDCLPLCASTEFGCCKDNSTATDTEKSNCPENAKKPVSTEEVSDCEVEDITIEGSGDTIEGSGDSVDQVVDQKPAKVCKKKTVDCKDSKFGCCPDEKTIKLDESGLGCSAQTTNEQNNIENITSSNITTSSVEQCQVTAFGCCPDGVTASQGADMQGCTNNATKPAKTCQSSQFGCCPDMIAYASGPEFAGCHCETLPNGCCPDGTTPARGPRFDGCDCRSSPHGCCNDGKTVAFGPRGLGCDEGPSLDMQISASACSLPKERGSCRNFTVKWFFDSQNYGGCSRFWYGGCEGNGNRFFSQDECEQSCMRPKGSDACRLPLVKGSCNAEKLYWGYNTQKHICEQFVYGGCLGNNNRFETRESCEQTCYYSENNDPCEQPLAPGSCSSTEQRYFYNRLAHKCEPFVYTGCDGNKNNFLTELDCRNKCGARTAKEICVLPVSSGTCLGKYPRYHFDYRSGQCKEFVYSGCEGNNNRFIDKDSCERLCNSTLAYYPAYKINEIDDNRPHQPIRIPLEDDKKKSDISGTLATLQYICNNNKDPGNCNGTEVKWYFNAIGRKCEQFYYSGCGGNNNRFDSKYDCEGRCIYQLQSYIKLQQELLLRQQQKVLEEQNQLRREQLEKQVILKQNICLQPRETGNCYNFVQRYYYDKDDKGCHRFYYSGCNGNENNFGTFEECTQRCGTPALVGNDPASGTQLTTDQLARTFRTEDCFLGKDRGPCDNHEQKWFYDSSDGVCKSFYWSGCGGNNNRFDHGRECMTKCWGSQNICTLPRIKGPCSGNFSQWYFDSQTKECLEFSYGGCQGNANRFSSKDACLESCASQSQTNYLSNALLEHLHNKKESDICHLRPEKGDGREYLEHYYFDPIQNMCKMFIYSGSGGNQNNFERRDDCERSCADGHKLEHPEPTDLSKRQEICLRPSDKGQCNNRIARWYYDPSSFTCLSFVYSGCGGNLNKFSTFDNCYKFCGGVKAKVEEDFGSNLLPTTTTPQPTLAPFSPIYLQPTPPPVPSLEERPPLAQPADCPVENCNNQRCTFGIDNYTDSRGCPRCRCSHPCHIHTCPTGQRCAVEVYRTETGQPLVQPICRLINKPGTCPTAVSLSQMKNCETTCRLDADCRGTDKCCNNGCAQVCTSVYPDFDERNDNSEESERLVQKVKLNDQAVLNCGLIPAKTEVSVAWSRDNRPITQTLAAQQNRIQILSNSSLLILQTRPEDNGEYACSYAKRETSELVTKKRVIEIYDPVSILPGPRQIIATLNQPSTLECNARGIPRPITTWWKDKKMLPMSSSKYVQNADNYQLRINSVSSSDAGVYYCQAHNENGPIKVWDVTLLLEFEPNLHTPRIPELNENPMMYPSRPRIPPQQSTLDGNSLDRLSQVYVRQGQIIQSPNNRQFSLDGRPLPLAQEPVTVKTRLANEEYKTGSSLKIDCITNQPANITWYYNNDPIETSNHLNNLARVNAKYSVVRNSDNSISVDTLIRQHSGVYKCKASNAFSYALSDLSVEVEDVPLPAKCKDSPSYLNCQTIVAFKYCSNKSYFTYCCRSCVLAKQISVEEVYRRLT